MDASAQWTVRLLHAESPAEDHPLHTSGLTLGRDPANDIVLTSREHPEVSTHHARLVLRDSQPILEDLDSTNGTYVAERRVTRHALDHGDVFRLGRHGPRLTVLRASVDSGPATQVSPPSSVTQDKQRLGTDTVRMMREQLGLSGSEGLSQTLQRRTRRNTFLVALSSVAVLALFIFGYRHIRDTSDRELDDLRQRNQDLQERIAGELAAEIAEREALLDAQSREREADRMQWETTKADLLAQQDALRSELRRLEDDDKTAAGALETLRGRLEETDDALERFNPVNLQARRLERVSTVERAVVLVEMEDVFVHVETGEALHFERTSEGAYEPNFEERGFRFGQSGAGSGFVLDAEGHILTNAHVVNRKGEELTLDVSEDLEVERRLTLHAVFSGESVRHPATLLAFAADGDRDLALLKIEPFDGMAHLDGFEPSAPRPPRGSDVFLLGFPLGTQALQEGDRVIASAFRGIVSRSVGPFIQVDAAVHPGNSGGPMIDGDGRVLGVVVGMQVVDEVAGSSAMGFVIPIADAGSLWPPKTEVDESDEAASPTDGAATDASVATDGTH